MKKIILKTSGLFIAIALIASSCGSTKEAMEISSDERKAFSQKEGDTIEIANDDIEYGIIIIEPGFNFWLNSLARPEGYYTQSFLENRNQLFVLEWNQRVLRQGSFDPDLYELQIDYQPGIDYGYDVNYKLYNYFIYFQRKYNQRLGPFVPRI